MAKQPPELTQHGKSLRGVFRFYQNHPDWMMANVFGVDDEHGHHAVKRGGLLWIGRSEGRAG
jgi:hypothetical protein